MVVGTAIESPAEMLSKLKKALNSKTITELQYKVYVALLMIPPGSVSTYKNMAMEVNCKNPRTVGQALKMNPYAPEVPCHRVIRTDLTLGGFAGGTTNKTTEKKMKLLESEGVEFQPMRDDQCSQVKVKIEHVWNFNSK